MKVIIVSDYAHKRLKKLAKKEKKTMQQLATKAVLSFLKG